MAMLQPSGPAGPFAQELEQLRKNSIWLLILGIVLIIVGIAAIGSAFVATLTTVLVFGILLIIGGGVQIVNAFCSGRWRAFWLHLLAGILYLVLGFLLVQHPVAFAAAFTLVLAACFMIGGLFRIFTALIDRFPGWGWVLLNGIITLILGVMIWRQWPDSTLWVIGLFVGIDMLFAGWTWVMTAVAVRSLPQRATKAAT
jgi:uncharacterized membrane protein HdeD (DUF308 family)